MVGNVRIKLLTQKNKQHPIGIFGFLELTGFPKLLEIERAFLNPDDLAKYEQSIGLYDPRAKDAALTG